MVSSTSDFCLSVGAAPQYWGIMSLVMQVEVYTTKSTTGFVFILYDAAISWLSRLQPIVATFTSKAEWLLHLPL